DSVSYIHVFDPYSKEYLRVECVHDEYADDLPRDAHRLIREHARRQFGDRYSIPQLAEAREAIQARINEAVQHKKMAQRKMGASLLQHDSEAVIGSKDPLQEAQKPISKASSKPPEELPEGLNDDLPEFNN